MSFSETSVRDLSSSPSGSSEVSTFKVNDYVIVRINDKKKYKYYVAFLIEVDEKDQFFAKFMKKSSDVSNTKFIFPTIEDLGLVRVEDIVAKLSQPEILRRGEIYSFTTKYLNKYLLN